MLMVHMDFQIGTFVQSACKHKSAGWIAALTLGDKYFTHDMNLAGLKTIKQNGCFVIICDLICCVLA